MKIGIQILKTLSIVLILASCKTQNILVEPKKERDNTVAALDSIFFYNNQYEYRIKRDDKITISVWGQDEISVGSVYGIYNSNEVYGKWLMVDAQGNIEVPKIGTLNVVDKTIIELKDTLKLMYAKWIVNPVIDVKVLNKEITVLGEVRDPQVLKVDEDQNSLLEIISKCSGFEFYADLRYVKVLRQIGKDVYVANIDLTTSGNYLKRNIQILPDDIIIVPSKKNKEFDKRVATIIPFTTTVSAAAILMGVF